MGLFNKLKNTLFGSLDEDDRYEIDSFPYDFDDDDDDDSGDDYDYCDRCGDELYDDCDNYCDNCDDDDDYDS